GIWVDGCQTIASMPIRRSMPCWSASLKACSPRSFPTHLRRLLVLSYTLERGVPYPPVARPLGKLLPRPPQKVHPIDGINLMRHSRQVASLCVFPTPSSIAV